jgi:hypothetical protein
MILSLQVPLLLSIGEEDTALMKATESGDTDLVYLVLFHIWQKVILTQLKPKFLLLMISPDVIHMLFWFDAEATIGVFWNDTGQNPSTGFVYNLCTVTIQHCLI